MSWLPSAALVLLGPHRDRHGGAQLDSLGPQSARVEELRQRARDDREHDVVDGAVEGPLDALEVLEVLEDHRRTAGAGPGVTVSGVAGGGFRPAHTTSPSPIARSRTASSSRPGLVTAPAAAVAAPIPSATTPPSSASHELRPSRARGRGPRLAGVDRRGGAGSTSRSNRVGQEVGAADAVDQRVVGLGDEREAAPSRPGPIHISHSGLERSRRWEKIRAVRLRSCSSLPGAAARSRARGSRG